ncbi:MAG: DUF2283 domain-containing protein [Anaerolineales bacterium]|nr:DUF2283 domain-containing protein [Anaerolineales bacterium]
MNFEYHQETDMLYIKLANGISIESEEISPGVVVDYDENNRAIGIEIEDASKFIDLSRLELTAMPIANLVISERMPTGV